ncbi:MAG: GAF domain-containing protein [Chloroflexi bacterium]|nr:GAF domain-containing protein [Chloroflexota bacterium]
MKLFPTTTATTRIRIYGTLFVLLVVSRFLLPADAWQGNLTRHMALEFMAAMLAMFVGMLALVRYFTRRDNVFLFIGVGFVGAGLLDGLHVLAVHPQLMDIFPWLNFTPRWIWNASPTFLSILIFGSWLTWRREVETGWYGRMTGRRLFLLIVGLTLINVLLFALVAQSEAAPSLPLERVELFISTTFYLWALVNYLAKGHWQHDTFEHWLIIALLLSFSGQIFFLFSSVELFDAYFEVALALKLASYFCVLVGLMGSIVVIFRQAARSAAQLQQANDALKQEIAERQRAERAEHEQRRLAEALREVGIALSATLDFDQLLERLLDQIAHVVPYDTANVMLLRGTEVDIVCTRGYGRSQTPLINHFALADMPSLQQMARTGLPLVIPDISADPAWVRAEASPHVRSWAGTPIVVQQEVVAFLALNYSQPNFYRPAHASRLAAFAGQAAIAIQNARLYKTLQQRVAELTTLNQISHAVTSSLDLQTTLNIVTAQATRLLDVDATSVVLVDRERGDLWFAAAFGQAAEFVRGKRLALGQGIVGWVAEHGEPLLITDAKTDQRHFPHFDEVSKFTARTLLCAPLQVKGQTIGAIEAINKAAGPFDEADLRLLTLLAGPAAAAIENAQLYEQARREIEERQRAEAALQAERALLADRVMERTADLSAANAELARAGRLKDEFLASMSHELRTPLNAVLGIAEALQDGVYGPLNDNQDHSLRSIEESGRHLLNLINDILDLSKIEAGKLVLERTVVSVQEVCQASLRFVWQEAHKKQLQVATEIDPSVMTIWADERRLKQILVNLLSNAVKFTAVDGHIGLEVQGNPAQKTVHFVVWDKGIGIAPENIKNLFRPFVQLDSRLSREYSGTGLGLSLVYRMTELHGGSVALTSEVGQGSRFTVSLPWDPEDGFGRKADTAALTTAVPHAADGKVILLAEDNDIFIETVGDYLTAKGYRLMVARNGREAIEQAAVIRPDLILMDIQMPEMDGLQAMTRLRAETATAVTPIVALTALAMPGDRERCLAAGANAYLSKPLSLKQLIEVIESFT